MDREEPWKQQGYLKDLPPSRLTVRLWSISLASSWHSSKRGPGRPVQPCRPSHFEPGQASGLLLIESRTAPPRGCHQNATSLLSPTVHLNVFTGTLIHSSIVVEMKNDQLLWKKFSSFFKNLISNYHMAQQLQSWSFIPEKCKQAHTKMGTQK